MLYLKGITLSFYLIGTIVCHKALTIEILDKTTSTAVEKGKKSKANNNFWGTLKTSARR